MATDPGGEQLRVRHRRPRRRTSVVGVIGEILITLGVVSLLYVAWQMWIGDAIIGAQFKSEAHSLSQQWAAAPPATSSPSPSPSDTPPPSAPPVTADPPILPDAANTEVFGIVHIPRFGPDYAFKVAGGVTTWGTLDPIGIGHYPGTSMPGQEGNFAVAGHRGSHGAPFQDLPSLHVGDAVVVETPDGWYTYRFRNLEYVRPTAVEVLLPVPQIEGASANGKYITMTTCSPRFGSSERAVAYGTFESFTPRSAGAPASLTLGAST